MQSKDSVRPAEDLSPFRRLPILLVLLRSLIRRFRLWKVKVFNRKKVDFADNLVIGPGARIYVPEFFKVEKNVAIGGEFFSQTNVRIRSDCLLSSRVSFVGNDHDIFGKESAYFSGRREPSTVILEGNNFIGFGATICGNVTIGEGSIVGACSLVIKSVPDKVVVAGVPARVIRKII